MTQWYNHGVSYEEHRVRVKNFGTVPARDPRLVLVPGVNGQPRYIHHAAAPSLADMSAACEASTGTPLLLASGWRKHRWKSWGHYEQTVIRRFGSVAEGRKWLAYNSPHETGLAADFGSGGLWPTKSTVDQQRKTAVHKWMVEHAYEFGWTPYKREPWHWEHWLTKDAWLVPPA